MTQIIDAELTENGLTELSAGRILLIACGPHDGCAQSWACERPMARAQVIDGPDPFT